MFGRALVALSLLALTTPAAAQDSWLGYQGQRLGGYNWGWGYVESPVFYTRAEAYEWTDYRAGLPGFWSGRPEKYVSKNMVLWLTLEQGALTYDYYGEPMNDQPTVIPETAEPRYCADWSATGRQTKINSKGLFIYDKSEIVTNNGDLAYAHLNNCQVNGVSYGIGVRPLPAVHETLVTTISPKNLGQCDVATPGLNTPDDVNVATGNKTHRETDLSGPLDFERFYNAQDYRDTGMGPGWRHNYSSNVDVSDPNRAVATRWDGQVTFYVRQQDGSWKGDQDIAETLHQDADGLSIRRADGQVDVFSPDGRLQGIQRNGIEVAALSYDGLGQLERVTDRTGRSLTLSYNDGKLVSAQAGAGTAFSYSYSTAGQLEYAGAVGSQAKHYLYGEPDLVTGTMANPPLTGIESESGVRYGSWKYNTNRRVLESRRHLSATQASVAIYQYNTGRTHVTTNGYAITYNYQYQHGRAKLTSQSALCGNCGGGGGSMIATRAYDGNGYPSLMVDRRGTRTDMLFLASGLESERKEGKSTATAMPMRTVQTDWDENLRVRGSQRTYGGDGALLMTRTWTRNARGQAVAQTEQDAGTGNSRVATSAFCEASGVASGACPHVGLPISVDGPRTDINDTTTYQYYAADHPDCATAPATCAWRKGDLWKVTNALGQATETLRYDGAGRALSVKDANGVITDFEYHPRGWLKARKVRGADNGSETDDQITRIDYYPTGLVSSTTLPDGSFTSYVYDAAHRLTDIVDADGNSIHYTLDNAGNRTKEEVKGNDGTLRRTLSRVYNQLGQLQTAKDAGDHPTGFTYDANGNLDKTTDALNRVADNDYDPLNRLSQTIQNVGGINAKTQFKYDAQDNLTEVIDPKGLSTRYRYNAFGDLTRLESPDTGVTTYGYDSAGNRTSALDARNEPSGYAYDALNRLTGITYSDASLNVTYTYDVAQSVCDANESFAVGRLTRMDDGSGHTRYCYDRFGNLTRKVQVTNGQSFTLRYAYTKAGQLAAMEYPDGMQVDYTRDGLGRVTEVGVALSGQPRQVLLTGATHHPFGPIAGWTFGNGRTMSRTLDLDYRPKTILSTGTGAGGLNLGFGWDAVGNMASLHTSGLEQPPRITFGYDALNRLTAFKDGPTGAVIEGYTYDATGNRTSFTNASGTQSYVYPVDSHRLTAVNGVARTYDGMGNTASIGGTERQFAYNAAGRMGQVERENMVAMQYTYNGKGEQVTRQLGGTSTHALHGGGGEWLGDYGVASGAIQQVIWLDGLPLGIVDGDKLHLVEADHLGSPRTVIDPQRDMAVWALDSASEAFGGSAPVQDPDTDGSLFKFDMRFPGQRYDAATGLNYNYFRDYDPGAGRYVQSDPIGLAAGVSTYGYVSGSPLMWADMYGLLQWTSNPIVWSPTLVPGLQTRTFPGDGLSTVKGSSLARTTLDWSISPACACSAGGFSLNEYTVGFTPIVLLRQSYSDSGQRRDTRRAELDHVRDFNRWISGSARTAAQALEDSMKGQTFSSMAECEIAARQAMQQLLQSGARQTAMDSHNRWDASGRHSQVVPGS